jgi:hypothetical protein
MAVTEKMAETKIPTSIPGPGILTRQSDGRQPLNPALQNASNALYYRKTGNE